MLNMRIVRGPLSSGENEAILREYNRLTSSRIPMDEFLNWTQKSPAGPAWHGILQDDDGNLVGHTSLFPFRTENGSSHLTPAKSEYSFLHEDFRKEKIRGFENASRAAFVVLLDQLFKHCQSEGWGPIFASTNEKNQAFTRRIGLQPLEFQVSECLYILRPINAARHTPNLTKRQRAFVWGGGVWQRGLWSASQILRRSSGTVTSVPVVADCVVPERHCLSFFDDAASLQWRYLDGQYVRFSFSNSPGDYVIAKKGSSDRYLRVCQWRLGSEAPLVEFVQALLREAAAERAMGVRWALYDKEPISAALETHMRRRGFVCAPRERVVMVHKKDPEFLTHSAWRMNDSLFSFDP
jgi:hypothetical protein